MMLAMLETHPDIAFATSATSRYAQNLNKPHMEAAKTILRICKWNIDQGHYIRWRRWKFGNCMLFGYRLGS